MGGTNIFCCELGPLDTHLPSFTLFSLITRPRPPKRVWSHMQTSPYLLCQQSLFVIDQSCSSITNYYIHDYMKILRLLEDGNEATRLFVDLEFQKLGANLHLIGSYSLLPGLASSHSWARSVHKLCKTTVNSSWLPCGFT